MALEGSPDRRGGEVHGDEIVLGPDAVVVAVEPFHERRHERLAFAHPVKGPAAFARPEAGLETGRDRIVEPAVLEKRFAGRAGQAAEDAGRRHSDEGVAVKGRIAHHQRRVEGFGAGKTEEHVPASTV